MGLFDGKKGLICGVANDRSIAWAIAKEIMEQGGQCGFTHLPDRADDDKQESRRCASKCIDGTSAAKFLVPRYHGRDEYILEGISTTKHTIGKTDVLLK